MVRNPIDIWFDFIDPASVLLMLHIDRAIADGTLPLDESHIRWHPLELRPPPTPLVGIDDGDLRGDGSSGGDRRRTRVRVGRRIP